MNRALFLTLLFAFSAVVISGCAATPPRYGVSVSALSSPEAANAKSYVLGPADENVSPDDLQFREFAEQVDRALATAGFVKVDNEERADALIFMQYAISEPKESLYSYAVPIFGQTGIASSSTYGSVNSYGSGYGTYSANRGCNILSVNSSQCARALGRG
jgi:hypothetical protein